MPPATKGGYPSAGAEVSATPVSPGPAPAAEQPTSSGQHLAQSIRVVQEGVGAPLTYVDGELLPYYTAPGPRIVQVEKGHLPGLTITLVAETVEVVAATGINRTPQD